MSKHRPTVQSETMEQQLEEGAKSKVSRSAARHLRRKKLVIARREAEKNLEIEINNSETQQKILVNESSNSDIISNPNLPNNAENKNTTISKKRKNVLDLLKNKNNVSEPCSNHLISFNSELDKTNADDNSKQTILINKSNREKNTSCSTIVNSSINKDISVNINTSRQKMDSQSQEKSKEQIKAEREAKKAAKAAAKAKGKVQDKLKPESSMQLNKSEKSKTQGKETISHYNSKSDGICSTSPVCAKQIVTQNMDIDETDKSIDVAKLEDQKIVGIQKTEEKSKAELRAERRAKQEAQRAAKQALLNDKKNVVKTVPEKVTIKEKSSVPVVAIIKEEPIKKVVIKSEVKENLHEVNLFKHLYINKKNISQLINRSDVKIHPAIIRLGVQYAEKIIVGSNARCVALLAAVKQLIKDYERPSQVDFTRGLEASLQESLNYLNFCRPSAVSMQNALKHLKWQMSTLPSTVPDEEAKSKFANAIDTYIQEQILLADKAISNAIQKKILNGDVILTYGFSSLIHKILCDAYTAGKKFRVVVVDGRPWLEGKELLRRLIKHGIDCSYILINALSFIMPQVSKVFLGAHAILANGAVMSRVGTAQVALIAKSFNVPVLVACETHKSCERVQTDSIVYNEIGDPDQLVKNTSNGLKKSSISNWKSRKTLNLLNITYDVTPADLVTAVVTELAILPCTSVPVILRIKPSEI